MITFLTLVAITSPAIPAWCGDKARPPARGAVRDVGDSAAFRALPAIVKSLCAPDEYAERKGEAIARARADWSKKLGLQDDDWRDIVAWVDADGADTSAYALRSLYPDKYAWSTLSPVGQFAMIDGSFESGLGSAKGHYITDALGPKLTETGRLAYIRRTCMKPGTTVEAAMCEPDLALLNRQKLFAELRGDKDASPTARLIVRLLLSELDSQIAEHDAEMKKLRAKDPAWGKLFEISAATRKEWDAFWKAEPALLDVALAMDDARATDSRKAYEGCLEKTRPVFEAAVSKIPGKKFEGFETDFRKSGNVSWAMNAMAEVTSTPRGYLAGMAYYTCLKKDKEHEGIVAALGSVMVYVPGHRGPRQSAHWAMLNAGLELDDAKAKIDFPGARFDNDFLGAASGAYFATIQKITPAGSDMVELSFAKKLEKQLACLQSKNTNRITQILVDGTLVRESVCVKWGDISVDVTPPPQKVHVRYSRGLKPGMNVIVGSQAVMGAWKKGTKSPVFIAGAPVN